MFNDAFFETIALDEYEFASFSPILVDGRSQNSVLWDDVGRFRQFLRIVGYCFKNRNSVFLFLTYDPLLLPVISIFCKSVMVVEHNTTPECNAFSKHAVWQRLTFCGVLRLAQYKQQYARLIQLGQRVSYLGSPINSFDISNNISKPNIIFIGSRHLTWDEVNEISKKFNQPKLVLRQKTRIDVCLRSHISDFDIEFKVRVDLDYIKNFVKAIYVNFDTQVRGSGWFNDAISMNIPLVLGSRNTKEIFNRNFPYHDFFDLNSSENLDNWVAKTFIQSTVYKSRVQKHNRLIRKRFSRNFRRFL